MARGSLERLERVLAWDRACVIALNRATLYRPCMVVAAWISRLGDGELWCAMILAMPFMPDPLAKQCALHMAVVGLACVLVYKLIKCHTGRPRPYVRLCGVRLCARPLDEFSFPSGHVLHAMALTVIALVYFPHLGLVLIPFAALTAVARVMLGLHYPSDVFAGALVGAAVAGVSFLPLII